MGKVAWAFGNCLMESFFRSMPIELLDRRTWSTPQLTAAIIEWIEAWDNPTRRHSHPSYRSPVEFEALHTAAPSAA